jgi:hypothetical protein
MPLPSFTFAHHKEVAMSGLQADQIAQIQQAIAALKEQQRTLHVDLSPSLNQMYQLLAQLGVGHDNVDQGRSQDESHLVGVVPTWGVRLNRHRLSTSRRSTTPSDDCPAWANPAQIEEWHKRGLVVWNNGTKQLHAMRAQAALNLLARLRRTDEWQTTGILVTERVIRIHLPEEPSRKRSRKKEDQPEPTALPPEESKPEEVDQERVRLDPAAGPEFIAYLEAHESQLSEIALEDKEEQERALANAYRYILRLAPKE